jgi:signal transduction histidine kinase
MNEKQHRSINRSNRLLRPSPQLALVLDATPQTAVLFYNKHLRYTYGEGDLFRRYGLPNEAIPGKLPGEIFPRELAETFSNMYLATLAGKKTEVRGRFKDRMYHVKSQPIVESSRNGEKLIGGFSIISDISDRCSSLHLISQDSAVDPMESEEYKTILEQILRTMDDMILVIDRNYHIVLSNLNSQQVSESSALCYRFFFNKELPCEECMARDIFMLKSETAQKVVETNQSRMLVSCHPFRDPSGQVRYVIERVSDIKSGALGESGSISLLAEKEEKQSSKQSQEFYKRTNSTHDPRSEKADREKSLKNLLSRMQKSKRDIETYSVSVTHDLKSPLRAVKFYLDMLSKKTEQFNKNELREIAEKVKSRIENMEQYVDRILNMSKDERITMEIERIDLSILALSVLENLSFTHDISKADIAIEEEMEAYGDPVLIAVVLENLIGNALKYASKKDQQKINVSSQVEDGFRKITVSDNGVGFDPERAEELFQPFKRLHAHSDFPGHGVGLSTVKKIILRHGGSVEAVSAPEGGASFSFSLPVEKGLLC